MWFFKSPQIVFGEDALSHLEQLHGRRAFIVTDALICSLGFVEKVQERLQTAGIESSYFPDIEPNPCLETVQKCAEVMRLYEPDWVIGLGGGSCMDAAKAAWFLYERPDVDLEAINPVEQFGLRAKARLLTIPTTAGSGAEVSFAAVISDAEARRKLELASYEILADLTIVDPQFSAHMPRQLTADTGIDVLSHAVEAYNNQWSNDFSDGLCMQAAHLVFKYLPRAVEFGAADLEAREKMANAATIAGLVITNTNISLAHALGHSAGEVFDIPHGRVTAIFLPNTIEYCDNGAAGRYVNLAHFLGLPAEDECQAAKNLAGAIRNLMRQVGLPLSLQEAGVSREMFDAEIEGLCDRAEMDPGLSMARRLPYRDELKKLFEYAFSGRSIDF